MNFEHKWSKRNETSSTTVAQAGPGPPPCSVGSPPGYHRIHQRLHITFWQLRFLSSQPIYHSCTEQSPQLCCQPWQHRSDCGTWWSCPRDSWGTRRGRWRRRRRSRWTRVVRGRAEVCRPTAGKAATGQSDLRRAAKAQQAKLTVDLHSTAQSEQGNNRAKQCLNHM